jgi:CheY-like chemotaxis protein
MVTSRAARKVLVVDDEPTIRLAIRACLEVEGYAVREAADGAEVLSAVDEQGPELILLDITMPRMDGFSTLDELTRLYGSAMPKVIILTAYGSAHSYAAALARGAAGFLEKPVLPEVLRQTVARVLAESPVTSI